MELQYAQIDGLNIRYASHFAGIRENIFLITPLPESILAFSPIWDSLAGHFNLVAIDLPGMNSHSEGREDLYAVDSMAVFVSKAIDHFNLSKPHLVGPDIGTPIGLFLAANFPGKLKSLIIGNGACVFPLQVDTFLKDLLAAPDTSAFEQIPLHDVINETLKEHKHYQLPPAVREDYAALRNGINWLPKALEILRTYLRTIPVLDEKLESITTPTQIFWGRNDHVATVANAEMLHSRLPDSSLHIIEDGGHYIWEDNAAEYLAVVMAWVIDHIE